MAVSPGDIVTYEGERRVVVDVTDDEESYAVLRFPDDDPRREVDEDGGDIHLDAAPAAPLEAVGRI